MSQLKPINDERPWGHFRRFTKNEPSTIKILYIKKGEAFSLQRHLHRGEFWKVLAGEPDITLGDKTIRAKVGDEFETLRDTDHRISATLDDVEILEISTGDFDEEDIIRKEDKYGRI